MSKKGRFRKGRGSNFGLRSAMSMGLPKTVVEITERGETKTFRSFNSLASSIKKLAKNSVLPAYCFYQLARTGETSHGEVSVKAWTWTPEWNDEFEKAQKESQGE